MNCATCTHIDLNVKDMARYHFGHCAYDELGHYKSLTRERECKLFAPAEEHVAAEMAAWLAKPISILQEKA
jgi:hypothetical protein